QKRVSPAPGLLTKTASSAYPESAGGSLFDSDLLRFIDGALSRQVAAQHGAVVKHKAAAVVVRAVGEFEVLEDAAFQLVHMGKAFFAHQDGGLFAADAASAEAHHGLVAQGFLVGPQG